MFKTRLISGIILIVLALATILPGGLPLLLMVGFISVVGMLEFYGAMNVIRRNKAQVPAAGKEYEAKDPNALKSQVKEPINALAAAGLVGAVNYLVLIAYAPKPYYLFGVVGTLTLLLAVYVFTFPRYHADEVMTAFFGIVYVAVCLSFIYQTRELPDGEYTVWLIVICSWGCDTMAYVFGRLFGKHKMAPVLSPKKSVEGAVGGVASAAVFGAIYAAVIGRFMQNGGNKIAVFAEKTIKEYGTHAELVHKEGGIYSKMFAAQAKYYA